MNVFLLTEANGEKRIAAHADHHGHGHDEQENREAERNARNAEAADTLAYEESVHNIVEGVHQHADDGRYRELQDQFRDACRTKGIEALGIQFRHFGAKFSFFILKTSLRAEGVAIHLGLKSHLIASALFGDVKQAVAFGNQFFYFADIFALAASKA